MCKIKKKNSLEEKLADLTLLSSDKKTKSPLVKVIILLSACKASSLTTSLKSIDENFCRVFQRPLACMNDPRASKSTRKQIISMCIRLGAMG